VIGAVSLLLSATALSVPQTGSVQETPKRILLLHSFGLDYFEDLRRELKAELTRRSPERVEFFEVSLEMARFAETSTDGPFVEYLQALFAGRPLDMVIAVAGPAARFCVTHREDLFPQTPVLLAGIENRVLRDTPPVRGVFAVSVVVDFTAAVENILQVTPDTTEIVMVLGDSAISSLWLSEAKKEIESLSERVKFTWFHALPLAEMLERVASLPPRTAVLFVEYGNDAGIVNGEYRSLESLRRASSAPLFGLFESQLGLGIVGGPLLSEGSAGRRAGAIAHRILNGEALESIEGAPLRAGSPVYDARELQRWGIAESLLPPGSTVLFRSSSLWEEYRWALAIGIGVVVLQTALIGGLLLHRSQRRLAEEEARAFARRLLTAHEDERSRLARELHDDLSQRLARLSIDAARMERSVPSSEAKISARSLRSDLARLSDDVHALSYQLHPSVLDDLGLNEALKVECEQFSRRQSIPASLTTFLTPPELPYEVALCLFRIAQEALRNAARHSRASRVTLAVTRANGLVRMTVSDDGVGFDRMRAGARHSLGHTGMKERAKVVGGTVAIESAPGRGTRVVVSLPTKPAAERAEAAGEPNIRN
jgi:signal transduction histidine kinase